MNRLKNARKTWQDIGWFEKLPLYLLVIAMIGFALIGYFNNVYAKELREAGFLNVKVSSGTAYVSAPTGVKPCRIALKRKRDWWYLNNPTNDGVPVRQAREVFSRQHVRTYCQNNKQPQHP